MSLATALLLLVLPGWLPWLVALVVLWPRGVPWLCRTCRRVLCRLRGCHDSVCLGLTDGRYKAECWFACRFCGLCGYMLPGEGPECVWQPRTSLAGAYDPHAADEIPPVVTEVRVRRKPAGAPLPSNGMECER